MAKIKATKETIDLPVKSNKETIKEKVVKTPPPVAPIGFDPSIPESKQRHLRT